MEGLRSVSGARMEFEFDGERHLLGPITLEHFGLFEQHLVRERRRAAVRHYSDVMDLMPEEKRESLWSQAMEDAKKIQEVTPQEVFRWIDSPTGMAYTLWVLFEDKYPGRYKLADLDRAMMEMATQNAAKFEGLKMDRDQAAGLDVETRGNQPGPVEPGPSANAPGAISSGNSPRPPKPAAEAGSQKPSSDSPSPKRGSTPPVKAEPAAP